MAIETAPAASPQKAIESAGFFMAMAAIMSATIVAGFVFQLAMGRSSFAAPWQYHVHGIFFMSWLGLYLAQHITASRGNFSLHARLGRAAYVFIPAMVAAGLLLMVTAARRNGGPFFFNLSEFLISNSALLLCFGVLTLWALRVQRHIGWHRRLMLCAMAILTGPGLGRLMPAPLLIPYAWFIISAVTWVFPLIGMIADKKNLGRVHPAYYWGLGLYVATLLVSMAIAYSQVGVALTEWLVEGSEGANRPIEAFLPPGFSM